jgi:hypothetical protein
VPHQLCHFHFLREAALPVFEADRHAKVPVAQFASATLSVSITYSVVIDCGGSA